MYVNGSGQSDPNGYYACAENAIDIKQTTINTSDNLPSDDYLVIYGNILYGFRPTDTSCAGTGSTGETVIIHYKSHHALVEKNLILFSSEGFSMSKNDPEPHHLWFRNNVLYDIAYLEQAGQGVAFKSKTTKAHHLYIENNTVVGAQPGNSNYHWFAATNEDRVIEFKKNLLIDAGSARIFGGDPSNLFDIGPNVFVNSDPFSFGSTKSDIQLSAIPEGTEALCIHTSLHGDVCVPHAFAKGATAITDYGANW